MTAFTYARQAFGCDVVVNNGKTIINGTRDVKQDMLGTTATWMNQGTLLKQSLKNAPKGMYNSFVFGMGISETMTMYDYTTGKIDSQQAMVESGYNVVSNSASALTGVGAYSVALPYIGGGSATLLGATVSVGASLGMNYLNNRYHITERADKKIDEWDREYTKHSENWVRSVVGGRFNTGF